MSLEVMEDLTEDLIAQQPPEAQALIRLLLGRIAELEACLGKTPEDSSLPPSAQHPHAKPQRPKKKAKRRRGGQPGRKKRQRSLIPSEQCEEVISLKPETYRRCGMPLGGRDEGPLRRQARELSEIRPLVTEYQCHRLTCSGCGERTCAALPAGVPRGQSGPRLVAFSVLLMAYFRQSKRRTAVFLETLLGQPCSTGLTVKHQRLAAVALEPAWCGLDEQLPQQRQLAVDETPTKEASQKAWLRTIVAADFTVFGIRLSRGCLGAARTRSPQAARMSATCPKMKRLAASVKGRPKES